MPSGLDPQLIVTTNPVTDRIVSRRLQVFRTMVFNFHYETRIGAGVVHVTSDSPQVLLESNWGPWRNRWLISLAAGGLMLIVMAAYAKLFAERAKWFAQHSSFSTIIQLGMLAALFSVVVVAALCLPRATRGWWRFKLPLAGIAAAWLWMLLSWILVTPSSEGVRAAIQRGDLQAARCEVEAIEAIGGASDELQSATQDLELAEADIVLRRRRALDEQHMQRVDRSVALVTMAHEVGALWEFDEARDKATRSLLERADAEMDTRFEQHDVAGLKQLAETIVRFDDSRAARARSRQALSEAFVCQAKADFSCVATALDRVVGGPADPKVESALVAVREATKAKLEERLRTPTPPKTDPLETRKQNIESLLDDGKTYVDISGLPFPLDEDALRRELAEIERTLEAQRKAEAAEREREQREAVRFAELEQRRVEREQARRARAEAAKARRADRIRGGSGRVKCCDGTMSGCSYGGSLRGCCSHHGGICS